MLISDGTVYRSEKGTTFKGLKWVESDNNELFNTNSFISSEILSEGDFTLGKLVEHYNFGGGKNYIINGQAFNKFIICMTKNKIFKYENIKYSGYKDLYVLNFDAYNTEYKNIVGSGAVYLKKDYGIVGFSDKWDFERQDGTRTLDAEFKTIIGSLMPGKPFWVLFGIVPPEQYRPTH
jgi:hypothetical protein